MHSALMMSRREVPPAKFVLPIFSTMSIASFFPEAHEDSDENSCIDAIGPQAEPPRYVIIIKMYIFIPADWIY
jgi:hypothetical protein